MKKQVRLLGITLLLAAAMVPRSVAGAITIISNPKNGATLTNSLLTATGMAISSRPITNVYYQLNSLPWATAAGTTNWSVPNLTLTPGTNILRACAVDDSGARSPTNRVWFSYVPTPAVPALTVAHSGNSVTVSWPYPSSGFVLQQNNDLNTTNWTAPGFTITTNDSINSITIAPPMGNVFFRLKSA